MGLEEFKEGLAACSSCGTCSYGRGPHNPWLEEPSPTRRCPELERYKFMSYSARGMLYLARLLYSQELEIDKDMARVFYACTGCGVCEQLCYEPFTDIFRAVKEEIVQAGLGPPDDRKKMVENIERFHNLFGEESVKRTEWAKGLEIPKEGDTLFFAGCRISYRQGEDAKATVALLRAANVEVAYLGEEEWCCGWDARWDGRKDIQEAMATHNLEAIKASGAERVILSCPHGYVAFKKHYPEMVGKLPFEVLHLTEFLTGLIKEGKVKFNNLATRLTYHDPCVLGRHSRIYEQPREILASIPGVELVEMERKKRYAWCCGGTVNYAEWCSKERLEEAKKVADTLVTACPLCFENLSAAAKKEGIQVAVLSMPMLLAKQLLGQDPFCKN